MDFCKHNQQPLLATIELTPSLDQSFKQVPNATHKFHNYFIAEARQSILCTVRLELVELPNVKRMSPETPADITRPIAKFYSSSSPATSAALFSYLATRTAVLFSLISVTLSLLTFCFIFTLYPRQWTRLFAHPLRFFRGTSGRFLHIVEHSQATDSDTSFLYLSVTEFKALPALAKKTLHRPSLNVPLPPTETINITKNPTNDTPTVSAPITNVPQRAYHLVSAPISVPHPTNFSQTRVTSLLIITSSLSIFTCNYVELRWSFRVSGEQIFSASAHGMFPCLLFSCSFL